MTNEKQYGRLAKQIGFNFERGCTICPSSVKNEYYSLSVPDWLIEIDFRYRVKTKNNDTSFVVELGYDFSNQCTGIENLMSDLNRKTRWKNPFNRDPPTCRKAWIEYNDGEYKILTCVDKDKTLYDKMSENGKKICLEIQTARDRLKKSESSLDEHLGNFIKENNIVWENAKTQPDNSEIVIVSGSFRCYPPTHKEFIRIKADTPADTAGLERFLISCKEYFDPRQKQLLEELAKIGGK